MVSQRSLVLCLAVLAFVCGLSNGNSDDLAELDKVYNEKECIMQGGICVVKKDCPVDQCTAVSGLCPKQRSRGVECCYGISVKETRCQRRGGSCVARTDCGFAPIAKEATDCQDSQVCCIFIN